MKNYIVYEKSTGRIIRTGFCSDNIFINQLNDPVLYGLFEGVANDITQYIMSGEVITNKPINPATISKLTMIADATDVVTISDIPCPTNILFERKIYAVPSGESFAFTVDTPGIYSIKLMSFPYLEKEFVINAS